MDHALVAADLHLTGNPRDAYRWTWFDSFIAQVETEKPARVILLGDLTQEKDYHSAVLVNMVVERLVRLARACDVYILRGNHDGPTPEHSYFRFVCRLPAIRWIDEPALLDLDGLGNCLFLPHTRDYQQDWMGIDFSGRSWIFAHNTFDGADWGHGRTADNGIPLSVFPRDARVVSGDVHVPQVLGPLTYVGAPYLINFGDDYVPRILSISDDKLRSIESTGPQKRLVEIDTWQAESSLELSKLNVQPGDIVKLEVRLPSSERGQWPKLRERVRAWADENRIVLHSARPQVSEEGTRRPRLRMPASNRSDEDIVRSYCAARALGPELEATGLELLAES